jgi:ABC-2 type transport system ATP-binding protein
MRESVISILVAERITVRRSGRLVLNGFSAEFRAGVTVLLGPNGAGKSTLLQALCGILDVEKGGVTWRGKSTDSASDLSEYRRVLGWMPQDPTFPPRLRVDRFLDVAAWLKSVDPADRDQLVARSLSLVGLEGFNRRKAGKLSGGESRRLALATALIAEPKVILLDEPTAGLDPDQRALFHQRLRKLARDKVIILSTHLLEDVEDIAERVVVVHRGRQVFAGSLEKFVAATGAAAIDLNTLRRAWARVIHDAEMN